MKAELKTLLNDEIIPRIQEAHFRLKLLGTQIAMLCQKNGKSFTQVIGSCLRLEEQHVLDA